MVNPGLTYEYIEHWEKLVVLYKKDNKTVMFMCNKSLWEDMSQYVNEDSYPEIEQQLANVAYEKWKEVYE